MSDKKTEKRSKLGVNALILSSSKIATMVISLAAGMMMARFRTLDERGTFSQMQLVISLVNSVLLLGIPNCINYFISKADSQKEKDDFISGYFTISTIQSIFIGTALVLGMPLIVRYFHNPMIASFAYFMALYPWATITTGGIDELMVANRLNNQLVVFRVTHSLLYLGVILIVQLCGWDFNAFVALFVGVQCAYALAVYIIANKLGHGLRPLLDPRLLKKILTFSVPIGLAGMVATLNIEIDKLMIGNLFSTGEMAVYTEAARELPVTIISAAFSAVLLPQLARMLHLDRAKDAAVLWGKAITIALSIIMLITAGCIAFAPQVIELLYSAKYLGGVSVFRVYCLIMPLRCTHFGIMLSAKGKTRFILYSSLCSLAINALLNYPFYLLFGFWGPALATLLSVTAMNAIQLAFTSKALSVPFSRIFPWRNALLITIVNIAFALVFVAARAVLPLEQYVTAIGEALILGAVWSVMYAIVLLKPMKKLWKQLNDQESVIATFDEGKAETGNAQ